MANALKSAGQMAAEKAKLNANSNPSLKAQIKAAAGDKTRRNDLRAAKEKSRSDDSIRIDPKGEDPEMKKKNKVKPLEEVRAGFSVYNNSGYIRTYTAEDHGEKAEALASQFAKKVEGMVEPT